eukprot:4664750-Pyramimonas_sp.AAC.1
MQLANGLRWDYVKTMIRTTIWRYTIQRSARLTNALQSPALVASMRIKWDETQQEVQLTDLGHNLLRLPAPPAAQSEEHRQGVGGWDGSPRKRGGVGGRRSEKEQEKRGGGRATRKRRRRRRRPTRNRKMGMAPPSCCS